MGQANVQEIMKRIRKEAREELSKEPISLAPKPRKRPAGEPLFTSESFRYINEHWHDWKCDAKISSHRKFLGIFIVAAKRFYAFSLWKLFFGSYIQREKQFQMHLVRFLNETVSYIDEKDGEHFGRLVDKVDDDVSAVNERTDTLYNEVLATAHELETKLRRLEKKLESNG
mgnify:CR=1 FL=1